MTFGGVVGWCISGKLWRARSRLYRSQILHSKNSTQILEVEGLLESSRRDLHNTLLCTALRSIFLSNFCQKFRYVLQNSAKFWKLVASAFSVRSKTSRRRASLSQPPLGQTCADASKKTCPMFTGLYRACSRLYRSQFLQVNMRWKALAEIYTIHSFAPFFNLKISAKNPQHFFAIELLNFRFFSFSASNFAFFVRIFDEILSGFRDKFQERVTCVAFSIEFAKTN